MNIKTFRAESLQEGLQRVYQELGRDAKIMHAREVEQSRLFGLARRRLVEITAAESDAKSVEIVRPASTPTEVSSVSDREFLLQLQRSPYETFLTPCPPKRPLPSEQDRDVFRPVPLGCWARLTAEQLNPSLLQRNLIAKFEEFVRFGGPIEIPENRRTVVALVGPTGAGKTSMIAKLASHYRLKEFKRVGLITTDTCRPAAVDQLARYAEMLELPFQTVSEPYRLKSALTRLGPCDLVLMDTPGIAPKNTVRLREIADRLDAAQPNEVLLLLSATGGFPSLHDACRRFESLSPTGLALTKTDETVGAADLYRFLRANPLPLRFLTTGQDLSGEIEVAGPARLASLA